MTATPRTVVLVSGDGSNLQAIIDQTRTSALPIQLTGVVSDRPGVRALQRAQAAGLAAVTVDFSAAGTRQAFAAQIADTLQQMNAELVVLAGFMRILPDDLVQRYQGRMLNVHPSLLPRYPGLHTYSRALAAGDAVHGTTVHFVIPELDAGPAILQYRVPIRPGDTVDTLRHRVQIGEHLIYPKAIAWLATGRIALKGTKVWMDDAPLAHPVVIDEVGPEVQACRR
ncbi:MAG: phosphoribosylglycinamide formyltransferase [Gammaproteobacteria bacterium]